MVEARLKGINKVRKRLADGRMRIHHYHRATGRPLTGEPGSIEFLEAYAAAEKTMLQHHAGTLVQLIRAYTLSPEFEKRAESTRKEYRRMLTKVEVKFGTMPIPALDDPRVRQDFMSWRAEVARSSGDREADNRLSVISAMLSWARDNGRVTANHIAGFRRLHKSDRSEMIWLPEHIEAFMNVAPVELQRALILALHTGQRQGDLLRLAWTNYDGHLITLRQGKTNRRVDIPCTAALKRMLDPLEKKSTVILATKSGLPWKARYFKSQWEAATKKAGIEDLHFHDLRGTAVTMLAEAGCTTPQIAAITGHSLKTVSSILDRYLARTRVLASEAVARFENASSTDFANRLQTKAPQPDGKDAKSLK
ncbi:tyrosine-type recombinase/integrase [Mesorhizobium sp. 8]|uniref:tyrosine-type recombinase/integrase n=1 Tax=Mesorhizobium sp. 8 TaxID=2584466 RepID=UPI001123C000|nr:tyrosine-type recombinase/integrase [Mesorhizobium sp. 8]QDC02306.1 integrase [Mesorhizobium sp. 8]